MTLRARTLTSVFIAFAGLFAIQFWLSSTVLLKAGLRLEQEHMERDISAARMAFDDVLHSLAVHAKDWASWDDTYAFMRDNNARYRQINLVPSTFATLDLDFLLLLRPDGTPLYTGRPQGDGVIAASETIVTAFSRGGALADLRGNEVVMSVVASDGAPLLVAAAPILASSGDGPSHGTLVMGRYLNSSRLGHIQNVTQLALSLVSVQGGGLTPDDPTAIRVDDSEHIGGYFLLTDYKGRPVTVVRIGDKRWIYAQSLSSQRYLLFNLAFATLAFFIAQVVLLHRTFLVRLARLDNQAEVIRREQRLPVQHPSDGADELDRLGETLVGTLAALQQTKEQLEHRSLYDPLTELANLPLLESRLTRVLEHAGSGSSAAILVLGIDQFTLVNDSLGRNAGDAVLIEVAQRLRACVRKSDTVARVGGDEFAILLVKPDGQLGVARVAKHLAQTLAEPFSTEGQELTLSVSVGAALFPDNGHNAATLLKNAGAAMRHAKTRERGSFDFYSETINAGDGQHLRLAHELRHAAARGELELHYQPQVDLATGRIVAFEALLRWHHPELGMVHPARFIPMAEESGAIVPIGEWVLRSACHQNREWQKAGLSPVTVSVNISVRQLRHGLDALIKQILAETHLAPQHLELEITESVLMDDPMVMYEDLRRLKAIGVSLALDDFGTGYSSLNYLRQFAFDKLKIDKSFIENITNNADDATITRTVIAMAKSLGLRSIAEGVESESQLVHLRRLGCDEVQGYFFSPPQPVAEATRMLSENRTFQLMQPEPGHRATVLLVDDEINVTRALRRVLQRDGYRILEAHSAKRALEYFAVQPVHVVLCDHQMPEMNGSELLSKVKELYPKTVRVLVTGYADVGTLTEAVNKGGLFKLIMKPWNNAELRQFVSQAVDASLNRGRAGYDFEFNFVSS